MNPSNIDISTSQICHLLLTPNRSSKNFSPHTTMSDSIVCLLKHYTIRSSKYVGNCISDNIPILYRNIIHDVLTNIKTNLININKKTPILATNIRKPIMIDENLPVDVIIHYLYNRKQGPCYGIILHDTIPFLEENSIELLDEHILSHLLTCSMLLVDLQDKRYQTKFIEVMYPTSQNTIERRLIEINKDSHEYVEYACTSFIQATRLYYVSKERKPNWSYKCHRCTQEGICSGLRTIRNNFSKLVRKPGPGTPRIDSSCTE